LLARFAPGLPYWSSIWTWIPYSLMGAVTVVTVLSGVDYFTANKKVLKQYF
jgi:CDP-diacylglycerol--glycerol-3-phosphate 3-phosphatidyltransferase